MEEELRAIQERAIKSGLVKENQKSGASYSFQTVLDTDLTSAQWAANEEAALLNGLDRFAASHADRRVETKKTVRRPTRPG